MADIQGVSVLTSFFIPTSSGFLCRQSITEHSPHVKGQETIAQMGAGAGALTSNGMQETPDTTERGIALITQGSLDPEEALQPLGKISIAWDYLTVLCRCPEPQQYIDGLYKVYGSYFANIPFI